MAITSDLSACSSFFPWGGNRTTWASSFPGFGSLCVFGKLWVALFWSGVDPVFARSHDLCQYGSCHCIKVCYECLCSCSFHKSWSWYMFVRDGQLQENEKKKSSNVLQCPIFAEFLAFWTCHIAKRHVALCKLCTGEISEFPTLEKSCHECCFPSFVSPFVTFRTGMEPHFNWFHMSWPSLRFRAVLWSQHFRLPRQLSVLCNFGLRPEGRLRCLKWLRHLN